MDWNSLLRYVLKHKLSNVPNDQSFDYMVVDLFSALFSVSSFLRNEIVSYYN